MIEGALPYFAEWIACHDDVNQKRLTSAKPMDYFMFAPARYRFAIWNRLPGAEPVRREEPARLASSADNAASPGSMRRDAGGRDRLSHQPRQESNKMMFREISAVPHCLPRGTRAGLWLAGALLCTGCVSVKERDLRSSVAHDATPVSPVPAAAPRAALPERLSLLASRYGICHADVAVIRNRELQSVHAGYGCAEYGSANQVNVFQAASLSKPVFAYAVLKLVQQGKMDLDAPVLSYLPHGYAHRHVAYRADSPVDQVSDPALRAVTVRMALNHTSGLPGWSNGPLVLTGKPGAQWQYSGEGYTLLQRAVEEVTGEQFGAFMQRSVFGPLGMTHSAYTREARLDKHIVPGTNGHGPSMTLPPFREPVAAFMLYTSARDYGRFLAALLKDERSLRQIVASPVPVSAKLDLSWGLGWGLERQQGEVFLWHWGNNPGYRAFAMVSPHSGDGFVMLTNSELGFALARPIGEQVLGGPHQVFRFHLLRDGLDNLLCEMLDVCS